MSGKGKGSNKGKKNESGNSNKSRDNQGNAHEDDQKKRSSKGKGQENVSTNGYVQSNGKNNKNKQGKKNNNGKGTPSKKGYSVLGCINWFLLLLLLVSVGSVVILCLDGNYTAEGCQHVWPCIQKNAQTLRNASAEALRKENLVKTSYLILNATSKGLNQTVIYVRHFLAFSMDNIEKLSKTLKPYTDKIMPYVSVYAEKAKLGFLWLFSSKNLNLILSALKWFSSFIYEQILVLKEELYRNEALAGVFGKLDYLGLVLWDSSESLRGVLWSIYIDLDKNWVPYIGNKVSELLLFTRQGFENFVK